MGAYEPKTFKMLNGLPANVRTRVDDHLRTRFGDAFDSQLIFVNGSLTYVPEFLRANPTFKWRVHTYELVFKYADPKHGLKQYYARTRLDSSGVPLILKLLLWPTPAARRGLAALVLRVDKNSYLDLPNRTVCMEKQRRSNRQD